MDHRTRKSLWKIKFAKKIKFNKRFEEKVQLLSIKQNKEHMSKKTMVY